MTKFTDFFRCLLGNKSKTKIEKTKIEQVTTSVAAISDQQTIAVSSGKTTKRLIDHSSDSSFAYSHQKCAYHVMVVVIQHLLDRYYNNHHQSIGSNSGSGSSNSGNGGSNWSFYNKDVEVEITQRQHPQHLKFRAVCKTHTDNGKTFQCRYLITITNGKKLAVAAVTATAGNASSTNASSINTTSATAVNDDQTVKVNVNYHNQVINDSRTVLAERQSNNVIIITCVGYDTIYYKNSTIGSMSAIVGCDVVNLTTRAGKYSQQPLKQ